MTSMPRKRKATNEGRRQARRGRAAEQVEYVALDNDEAEILIIVNKRIWSEEPEDVVEAVESLKEKLSKVDDDDDADADDDDDEEAAVGR